MSAFTIHSEAACLLLCVAAVGLSSCSEPERAPVKQYAYECIDPLDGHRFTLRTGKIEWTSPLFGEPQGKFVEPNGRGHVVTNSWVFAHCAIPGDAIEMPR